MVVRVSLGLPETSLLRGTARTGPGGCLADLHQQALFEHPLCAQPWARPDLPFLFSQTVRKQMRVFVPGPPSATAQRPMTNRKYIF